MIRKTILFPVLLMLLLLGCARAETAPECIILGETQVSIDMANVRTHQLTASVLPAEADQTIVWASSDHSVLTVEDGLITALKTGSCTVTAYVPGESTVFAQVNVTVTSSLLPTALTSLPERIILEPFRWTGPCCPMARIPRFCGTRTTLPPFPWTKTTGSRPSAKVPRF